MKLLRLLLCCVIVGIVLYLAINISICVVFGGLTLSYLPEDGVWFCEALNLQLSFDEEYDCYYIINGTKIRCTWENDRGSRFLTVLCQDSGVNTYSVGEVIFSGNCIEQNGNYFVIENEESGDQYMFFCMTEDSSVSRTETTY